MAVTRVLVDTGPLVAILSKNDRYHEICTAQSRQLPSPLFTCWPVRREECETRIPALPEPIAQVPRPRPTRSLACATPGEANGSDNGSGWLPVTFAPLHRARDFWSLLESVRQSWGILTAIGRAAMRENRYCR